MWDAPHPFKFVNREENVVQDAHLLECRELFVQLEPHLFFQGFKSIIGFCHLPRWVHGALHQLSAGPNVLSSAFHPRLQLFPNVRLLEAFLQFGQPRLEQGAFPSRQCGVVDKRQDVFALGEQPIAHVVVHRFIRIIHQGQQRVNLRNAHGTLGFVPTGFRLVPNLKIGPS